MCRHPATPRHGWGDAKMWRLESTCVTQKSKKLKKFKMSGLAASAASGAVGGAGGSTFGGAGFNSEVDYFGIVTHGKPVTLSSACQRVPGTNKWTLFLPNPSEHPDLTLFLLPTLPVGYGVAAFYTFDGANYAILGTVKREAPSAILRTGWAVTGTVSQSCGVR